MGLVDALAQVFNQTNGMGAANAGLGVGQRAHLYAQQMPKMPSAMTTMATRDSIVDALPWVAGCCHSMAGAAAGG